MPIGQRVRGLQPAEVTGLPVVIQDHVAVQVLQLHQPNTSRALRTAATRLLHLRHGVVAGEGGARSRRDAEEVMTGMGAMMAGPHRDSLVIQDRAQIVRMDVAPL